MAGRAAAFLALLLLASPPAAAGTVEDVRSSGTLTCGLDPDWPGFSERAPDYSWRGFNVDLCRAIAAAVVGDGSKVNLTPLSAEESIVALQSGEVDVLLHRMAWTQGEDAKHGLMFVAPTFFAPLATLAPDHPAAQAAPSAVAALGPLVRQGDDQWFHVVRGVIFALTQLPAAPDPQQDGALSLTPGWQGRAVAAAGSYRDMLGRHFGPQSASPLAVDPATGLPPDFKMFSPP